MSRIFQWLFGALLKNNKFMKISIIICTYNRCESLKDTLDSLIAQDDNTLDYEVIVVDNNSKDATNTLVKSYIPKFNGCLRYIFEPKQGLSYARNRGIYVAKGEIVAFTDDDCIVGKEWLWRISTKFKENPELDCILGKATWKDGDSFYRNNSILRGNGLNMCFKKEVFKDLGGFDIHLGSGSVGYSADDTEFIYRAKSENKRIIIAEDIVVVHKHRINRKEELKITYRDAKGYIIFWLKYLIRKGDIFALKKIYWFISGTLSDFITAIKSGNKDCIRLKANQIYGGFMGAIKGLYIWLFLVPIKSICQRSA